jgi:DNA-binding beta-propeller fold protein YncE
MDQLKSQTASKEGYWLRKSAMLLPAVALLGAMAAPSGAQSTDDPAYLTLQGDHAVSVRDSHTLAPIAMIPTDGQSIDSRITPDGTKLYTLNVGSAKMTVIRAKCPGNQDDWNDTERAAGKCVPDTQLPAVTIPGNGGFYFSIRHDGKIIYVTSSSPDPAALKDANPFTSSLSFIYAIDTHTDKILKTLAPPRGKVAIAGEISPDGETLWIATADGFLQGLDPNTGSPFTPTVFVGLVPATIKCSPDGRRVYAANMPPGPGMPGAPPQADKSAASPVATVGVVDTKALKLIESISVTPGSAITGIEMVGERNQVWTANGNNIVSVIDTRSLEVVKTITTPFSLAEAVDVSIDGERALVIGFNGKLFDPGTATPAAKAPAFAQLYSTKTFEPIGDLVSLGNNSGGIPSFSAQ